MVMPAIRLITSQPHRTLRNQVDDGERMSDGADELKRLSDEDIDTWYFTMEEMLFKSDVEPLKGSPTVISPPPAMEMERSRSKATLPPVRLAPGPVGTVPEPVCPPPEPVCPPPGPVAALPEPVAALPEPVAAPARPLLVEEPAGSAEEEAPARQQGKIVVFFGCRGGAGTTTIVTNVAGALARSGRGVVAVDLDLQLGDLFVALDLEPRISITSLSRDISTLDGPALHQKLDSHSSGLCALTQTGELGDVDTALPERLPDLFRALAKSFDAVVVDGVRDFGDHSLSVLDMADEIALVITQDVPSVRRAGRIVQLCRELGYSDRKFRVVLNRFAKKSTITVPEIESALGLPVHTCVGDDPNATQKALEAGQLLSEVMPRAGVTRDMDQLGRALLAPPTKERVERRSWLFGRKR